METIKGLTQVIVPLLDSKEKENRKLKRLLSERHGLNNETDIQSEEIGYSSKKQKSNLDEFQEGDPSAAFNTSYNPIGAGNYSKGPIQRHQRGGIIFNSKDKGLISNINQKEHSPTKPSSKFSYSNYRQDGTSNFRNQSHYNIVENETESIIKDEMEDSNMVPDNNDGGFKTGRLGNMFKPSDVGVKYAQNLLNSMDESLDEMTSNMILKKNLASMGGGVGTSSHNAYNQSIANETGSKSRPMRSEGADTKKLQNSDQQSSKDLISKDDEDNDNLNSNEGTGGGFVGEGGTNTDDSNALAAESLLFHKKMDKELFDVLLGYSSSQDSFMNNVETQESASDPYPQLYELKTKLENMQTLVTKPVLTVQQHLDELYQEYSKQYMQIVSVNFDDPIIKQVIGEQNELVQIVDSKEQLISFENIDVIEQTMVARELDRLPNIRNRLEDNQIKMQSSKQAELYKFQCICTIRQNLMIEEQGPSPNLFMECQICSNKKLVGSEECFQILYENIKHLITTPEFDIHWVQTQYCHVVWKLACYQQFFKLNCLNLPNFLNNIIKKMKFEFIHARRSFFQKSFIKEADISSHVVLLISNIQKSKNKENANSYVVDLYDGQYDVKVYISEKITQFDCDSKLSELITANKFRPGDKYHFYGLYMQQRGLPSPDNEQSLPSKNYYLSGKHNIHLKINFNGMLKAENGAILGQQVAQYFRKKLSELIQHSKQIPCIDIFVARKYPIYYLEDAGLDTKLKKVGRSVKAMDKIKIKKLEKIKADYQQKHQDYIVRQEKLQQETSEQKILLMQEEANEKIRDIQKSFKLCFTIKVVDALHMHTKTKHFGRQTVITFINATPDDYDAFIEGRRYRFYQLQTNSYQMCKPQKIINQECLFLRRDQTGKTQSSNYEEMIKEEFQVLSISIKQDLQQVRNYGASLIQKSISINSLFEKLSQIGQDKKLEQKRVQQFKQSNEVTFVAYLIKVMYAPDILNPDPKLQTVVKAVLLTSECDIICLETHDQGFFIKNGFPDERQKVFCDNIIFQQLSQIQYSDSSNQIVKEEHFHHIIQDYPKVQKSIERGEFFYFMLCTTNNNSIIEVQSTSKNQNKAQFDQLDQVLLNRDLLKTKIDQIQIIFGQKDPNLDNSHNYIDFNQALNPGAIGTALGNQNDMFVTYEGILNSAGLSKQNISATPLRSGTSSKVQSKKRYVRKGTRGTGGGISNQNQGVSASKLAQSIAAKQHLTLNQRTIFDNLDNDNDNKSNDDSGDVLSENGQLEFENRVRLKERKRLEAGLKSDVEEDENKKDEKDDNIVKEDDVFHYSDVIKESAPPAVPLVIESDNSSKEKLFNIERSEGSGNFSGLIASGDDPINLLDKYKHQKSK